MKIPLLAIVVMADFQGRLDIVRIPHPRATAQSKLLRATLAFFDLRSTFKNSIVSNGPNGYSHATGFAS
jgi:hypothetical protein